MSLGETVAHEFGDPIVYTNLETPVMVDCGEHELREWGKIVVEDSRLLRRFVLLDERKDETFEKVFLTLEDANHCARVMWSRLTASDRKDRHMWVGEDRTGDYGKEIDGAICCDLWEVEGGFDSDSETERQ